MRRLAGIFMIIGFLLPSSTRGAVDFNIKEFSKISFDAETAYVTKYLFRGFDILDDKGAIQPSLTAHFGDTGLWFNIWGSFALSGGKTSGDVKRRDLDELDWVLGYDREINKNISLSAGYIFYHFPNTGSNDEVNEFFGSFTLTSIPFDPTFTAYYDFPASSGGPGAGWFYEASISHTLDLKCPATEHKLPLDLEVLVGANDGVYGVDTGGFVISHVLFNISTTIETKLCNITPGFTYQISTNKAVNPENEAIFTISLSKSF